MGRPKSSGKAAEKPDLSGERARVFATLVYPESAPEGWQDKLSETHVQALVSPLHDRDKNPNGEQKKPHYHVLLLFDGMKSYEQAGRLRSMIGGVGWEEIASTRGYARYLCHLDNPEKAQYDESEIREFGGADYREIIKRASDNVRITREMMRYIREHNVLFFSDFLDYCMDEKPDWYDSLVSRNMYATYTYVKARAAKAEKLEKLETDIMGKYGRIDGDGNLYIGDRGVCNILDKMSTDAYERFVSKVIGEDAE